MRAHVCSSVPLMAGFTRRCGPLGWLHSLLSDVFTALSASSNSRTAAICYLATLALLQRFARRCIRACRCTGASPQQPAGSRSRVLRPHARALGSFAVLLNEFDERTKVQTISLRSAVSLHLRVGLAELALLPPYASPPHRSALSSLAAGSSYTAAAN